MKHYSPLRAGLAFLPLAIMVTVGSTATGRAVRRISPPVALTTGFLITLAGLIWLAVTLRSNAYLADILPGLLLSGFGHGTIYTATFIIGSRDVPAVHQGTAGALLTTAQYLSGALTLAVLTLMLGSSRSYPGFTSAFVLLAAAAGAGALPESDVSRVASLRSPPGTGRFSSSRQARNPRGGFAKVFQDALQQVRAAICSFAVPLGDLGGDDGDDMPAKVGGVSEKIGALRSSPRAGPG